jgi:hypothetical protein
MPTAITSEWPVTRADRSPQDSEGFGRNADKQGMRAAQSVVPAGLPWADALPPGGTLAVMNVTFFHGDNHSLGHVARIRHHSMA